jgi:rhamnosyltransferase
MPDSERRMILMKLSHTFSVIIPTLNASQVWSRMEEGLKKQRMRPHRILIVDSESNDGTAALASRAGFEIVSIPRHTFNHGGTRSLAASLALEDGILVYLTQDCILANEDSLETLLSAFSEPQVGAAYGRQLPHLGARPIEAHARNFNYPPVSDLRSLESRQRLGFKAAFISNSFAAYRRSALEAVGGFPSDVIFGEDTVTAARMLVEGWKIAYVAEAEAYHSHTYSWRQDFRRYFDIGVLHARESWMIKTFGTTGGEGSRFVFSELAYLWPKYAWLIPSALIRTAAKFAGYRLGLIEARLSPRLKYHLSMHRTFWRSGSTARQPSR